MVKRLQALFLILATAQAQHQAFNDQAVGSYTRSITHQDASDAIPRVSQHAPAAMRKMYPGEKFYHHYWQSEVEESGTDSGNASILAADLLPPLQLHFSDISDDSGRYWPRSLFSKRGYQCPADTISCTSIGRPNSCCGTGETCQPVADTGSGDVGCCPPGATCGGSISSCAAGYTACPDSSNGGCCIPGYACNSIGCIAMGSTTITASGSTVVVMATSITSASTSTTYQVVPSLATTTTLTSTTTFTPSSTPGTTVYTTTTTPTSTVTISPSISTATALTVTTITASPAVLATLNSAESSIKSQIVTSTITSTASSQTSPGAASCPTGFYQCSAYYQGCCQIGYGCGTSSCLITPSSATIVSGSDVTIVVATGSGVTTVTDSSPNPNSASPTSSGATVIVVGGASSSGTTTTTTTAALLPGMCATGWYSCAAGDGGGCCPSGYSCAASCIATQTGEPGKVYKVPPSSPANQIKLDYLMTHILSAVMIGAVLVSL